MVFALSLYRSLALSLSRPRAFFLPPDSYCGLLTLCGALLRACAQPRPYVQLECGGENCCILQWQPAVATVTSISSCNAYRNVCNNGYTTIGSNGSGAMDDVTERVPALERILAFSG